MSYCGRAFACSLAFAAVTLLAACGGGDDDGGATAGASNPFIAQPLSTYAYPIEMFPDEVGDSERHFAAGEFEGYGSVVYNTDPPTSGRHVGEFAQAAINDLQVPDEILVHMMEHGYVVIWYNCNAAPILTTEECASVRNSLGQLTNQGLTNGQHVVMSPDASMEHHIALTAWQFMDTFDEFDQDRVQTFINTLDCHYDPENTCE